MGCKHFAFLVHPRSSRGDAGGHTFAGESPVGKHGCGSFHEFLRSNRRSFESCALWGRFRGSFCGPIMRAWRRRGAQQPSVLEIWASQCGESQVRALPCFGLLVAGMTTTPSAPSLGVLDPTGVIAPRLPSPRVPGVQVFRGVW